MRRLRVFGTALLATTATVLIGFAGPVGDSPPVIVHQARQAVFNARTTATWASSNWSGYAETGHFTAVSGSWTVPTVTAGASSTSGRGSGLFGRHQSSTSQWFSATWLGIDGFNNDDLIQTGTEQDYYSGAAHYSAWWEILPAAETTINEPVSPGDVIDASIVQTPTEVTSVSSRSGRGRSTTTESEWTITIHDVTEGWTFMTSPTYSGPGSSAEWIVEAPEVNGATASLSNYTFPSTSAINGDFNTADVATTVGGSLSGAGLNYSNDAGAMIQNGVQVSTPSAPDPLHTAFNSFYGATALSVPTS